jgi:hypothetical protein
MAKTNDLSRTNANYKSVSISTALYERIKKIKGVLGYSGYAHFVDQAVRQLLRMEEMRYETVLARKLKEERSDLEVASIRAESDY